MKIHTFMTSKGKCAECRTPVRNAVRVISVDDDGKKHSFERLCRRCLEAEKVFACRVVLYADGELFEEFVNPEPSVPRPTPLKIPVAA
jgi:hypothetical protein